MKKIQLNCTRKSTRGYIALVGDEDFEKVSAHKWSAQVRYRKDGSVKTVYAHRRVSTKDGTQTLQPMHRFILGVSDTEIQIDHKDHNGLNNQRYNLRKSNNKQNQQNARIRTDNTSGFKGVFWRTASERWLARITVEGKRLHLGSFTDPLEAAYAYDKAAIANFGEFAHCNF